MLLQERCNFKLQYLKVENRGMKKEQFKIKLKKGIYILSCCFT
jgi:predicted metal-binding membrane protein